MKTKKKISKKMIMVCLSFALVMMFATTAFAATYVKKYAECDKCHTINGSYGYDETISITTRNVVSGNYCPVCNATVPDGEEHTYEFTKDRYYFLCNSSSCKSQYSTPQRVYYRDYQNAISDHYITYFDN